MRHEACQGPHTPSLMHKESHSRARESRVGFANITLQLTTRSNVLMIWLLTCHPLIKILLFAHAKNCLTNRFNGLSSSQNELVLLTFSRLKSLKFTCLWLIINQWFKRQKWIFPGWDLSAVLLTPSSRTKNDEDVLRLPSWYRPALEYWSWVRWALEMNLSWMS